MTRLPLPLPARYPEEGTSGIDYTADQMHAHAAAVSAAECEPLMAEIEALRQDGSRLAADNAALRERVKALEDAVQHYESALRDAWPEGAKGAPWEFWNRARIVLAALEAK